MAGPLLDRWYGCGRRTELDGASSRLEGEVSRVATGRALLLYFLSLYRRGTSQKESPVGRTNLGEGGGNWMADIAVKRRFARNKVELRRIDGLALSYHTVQQGVCAVLENGG